MKAEIPDSIIVVGALSATADLHTLLEEKGEELFRSQFNLLAPGHQGRANSGRSPNGGSLGRPTASAGDATDQCADSRRTPNPPRIAAF